MSKRLYDAFCANVRERMEELDLSQSELAKQLKVTPSFVSQLLNGHLRPGLDTLDNFAKALKCEAADLIRIFSRTA
jgi:transcriptional regulator with XRE-family HTH domain